MPAHRAKADALLMRSGRQRLTLNGSRTFHFAVAQDRRSASRNVVSCCPRPDGYLGGRGQARLDNLRCLIYFDYVLRVCLFGSGSGSSCLLGPEGGGGGPSRQPGMKVQGIERTQGRITRSSQEGQA